MSHSLCAIVGNMW